MRIEEIFKKKKNILNIYVTAGYPRLNDTTTIVSELVKNGVDMVEIGMPFSDPLADGPTIQRSSEVAIKNGITLDKIFDQVDEIRHTSSVPILLMGYYNQVLSYGDEAFFAKAKTVGVDGFIIPDLPLEIYIEKYESLLKKLNLNMVFLITPQTSKDRILKIDQASSGFLYLVSSFAITGSKSDIQQYQLDYFEKIKQLNLSNPTMIGFGISDKKTFQTACQNANGAIIGSAFIQAITEAKDLKTGINNFIKNIR